MAWRLRLIRSLEIHQNRRETPIVAMTAHVLNDISNQCIESGMNGYISKPIDTEELFATIARLVPAPEVSTSAETSP